MAELVITTAGGAVTRLQDTCTVRTPDGPVLASSLEVDDYLCLFSDGYCPVKITNINTE